MDATLEFWFSRSEVEPNKFPGNTNLADMETSLFEKENFSHPCRVKLMRSLQWFYLTIERIYRKWRLSLKKHYCSFPCCGCMSSSCHHAQISWLWNSFCSGNIFYLNPSDWHLDFKKEREVQTVCQSSVMTDVKVTRTTFIHYWNVPGVIQSTLDTLTIYPSQ